MIPIIWYYAGLYMTWEREGKWQVFPAGGVVTNELPMKQR